MTQAAGEILRLFDTEIFGKERKQQKAANGTKPVGGFLCMYQDF